MAENLTLKEKSKLRKQTGLFIIEGKREILLAIKGCYKLESLYYCTDLFSAAEAAALISYATNKDGQTIEGNQDSPQSITDTWVFEKLENFGSFSILRW